MKKFRYIIMLLAVIGFTACDNKSIEDLQGEFNNITFCTFNNGSVQPTTKLGKGIKALNTQFTDAAGNSLSLSFGSKEWILGEGTYQPVATLTTGGTYAGSINGAAISEGSIDVSAVNGCYFISGLVKTSDGKQYKPYFKGELTFIVGEDDPEPSGYTMTIATSEVAIMDWTTFQNTVYPDVMFDAINGNNKQAADLAGTYTIVGDAHDAMQISAGYSIPDYGMAGGTSYLDNGGTMQYLTGGSVEITTAKSAAQSSI